MLKYRLVEYKVSSEVGAYYDLKTAEESLVNLAADGYRIINTSVMQGNDNNVVRIVWTLEKYDTIQPSVGRDF